MPTLNLPKVLNLGWLIYNTFMMLYFFCSVGIFVYARTSNFIEESRYKN